MPMIVTIESEELEILRTEIVKKYLQDNNHIRSLVPNSFPGTYNELIVKMREQCPDYALEFSTKRLVKLFYFTNPVKCKNPQNPNFGSPFIEGCYAYISNNTKKREDYLKVIYPSTILPLTERGIEAIELPLIKSAKSNRYRLLILSTVILICLILSGIYKIKMSEPKTFLDNFDDISTDALKARGWHFWCQNDSLLKLQPKKECFTLYTTRGDNWMIPTVPIRIDNLMYRELESDCAEVATGLVDFNPHLPWQQAGIIFFEDTSQMRNFVRLTLAYTQEINGTDTTKLRAIQVISIYNQVIKEKMVTLDKITDDSPPKTFSLYALVKNGQFNFKINFGGQLHAFKDIFPENPEMQLPLRPKYVGIAAFHGFGDNPVDFTFKKFKVIPAHFDYFRINPIRCKY